MRNKIIVSVLCVAWLYMLGLTTWRILQPYYQQEIHDEYVADIGLLGAALVHVAILGLVTVVLCLTYVALCKK